MAALAGWVREVVVVVLLGWALEAFLPTDGFRRYVRLVVGLLVVLAVLEPALRWLHEPLPAISVASPPAAAGATASVGQAESLVLATYRQNLANAAVDAALSVPGVRQATAQVTVAADPTGASFGHVTAVDVDVAAEVSGPSAALVRRVRTAVASALGVSPGVVRVGP